MKRLLVVLIALLSAACSSAVKAPIPSSSVEPPATEFAGQVKLDLGLLADDPVCSKADGLEELCVGGLRSAMEQSLRSVLDAHFDGAGPEYLAKFRFSKLTHGQADGEVAVSFGWTFTLVGKDSGPVLMLDERTTGPETFAPGAEPDQAVGAALEAVLDAIAEPVASAEL